MNQDKLIIVERPDPDLVIISNGVEGKRGPIGPRGFNGVGIKGDKGDKGDSAKELQIEVTGSSSIIVGSEQHGIQYVTTNTAAEVITVVLNECNVLDEENNVVDHKGTVVLFTQGTNVPVAFTTVEGVELILPKDTLPQVYGIGCSVGVIARDRYTWILVGDLALGDVIIEDLPNIEIFGYGIFPSGFKVSLEINGTSDIPEETVTWSWNLNGFFWERSRYFFQFYFTRRTNLF